MKEEYPLFPELTEQGKEEAQALINKFEIKIKEIAVDVIKDITTDFYCHVLNEIESDHWQNYRTKLINGLCDYSNKDKATYDFSRIRKAIYDNHKDEIVKDLNQDLLKQIEDLKRTISNLRSF